MYVRDDGVERHRRSLVGHIVIPALPELGGRGIEGEEGEEVVDDMILL